MTQTDESAMPAELDDLKAAYQSGMGAEDYMAVQQWIKDGCPKTPDRAFTSGPARQAARLVVEALKSHKDKT